MRRFRHFLSPLLLAALLAAFSSGAFAQNNQHDFTPTAVGGAQSTVILVSTGMALVGTTPTQIAATSLTLTPSTTNYVYVDTVAGDITFNTSGFTDTDYPVATVVTDAIHVTSLTDDRPGAFATGGGGGSGTVTNVATGNGLTGGPVTTSGTISCATSTSSVFGCVKPDGTTITAASGVISAVNSGTVTSFSTGNLSPLFTASVATSTSTPALSFSLSNAGAYTVFGNATNASGVPGFTANPAVSSLILEGATSGSFTLSATATGSGLNLGSNASVTGAGGASVTNLTNSALSQDALVYAGAGGINTGLNSPTANGNYLCGFNVSAGAAVAPTCVLPGVIPNPQTGTTYTYLYSDRAGYVSFSNASSIAVTLPSAASTGFTSDWVNDSCDIGVGTVTITPTTSTISYSTGSAYTSAASTMTLTTGQCARIYSDGTNYFAIKWQASSGTPSFPVTVAGTVTSGGIPYFSNTTTETSSGILNTNILVKGGGAGGAPTNSTVTDNGTTVSTTENVTISPTSTSQVGLTVTNPSGTTANIANFVDNATTEASIGNTGILALGTTTIPTFGTGAAQELQACGTAPSLVASTSFQYCNASNFFDISTGTTDLGDAVAEASIIGANVIPKAIGTNPGIAASSMSDNGTKVSSTEFLKMGNTQLLTANATPITATTPGTTVFTWGALPASTNFSFHCAILYNQQTAAVLDGFSVQGATNAPTRLDAWASMYTTDPTTGAVTGSQGSAQNITSTTATSVVTGTPGAITTVYQATLDGTIQVGASASTLNILMFTGSGSDSVTPQAGSYCTLMP